MRLLSPSRLSSGTGGSGCAHKPRAVGRSSSFFLGLGSILSLAAAGCGPEDAAEEASRQWALRAPNPAKTVTIHVHGWNLSGASDDGNVGDDRGGGDTVDGIRRFTGLPHGSASPTAPNQIVATEYYGSTFPAYYSAADIAQVSALKGIPRYALIVAKYARSVMDRSGAEGFNLTCHSMGCLISRYILENDVEHLVSEGKLRRWVSFAGVVAGAKLADIDHGRWLDGIAKLLGFDLIDVEHMSHDWVEQYVAVYDHKRLEGNNPNFGSVLVHHILSTDPKIDTALDIPLLDVFGYGNAPNDGIVLDEEMFVHQQQTSAQWLTPSGERLPVSTSHHFANHFNITEQVSAQALASAALVGSRRVRVTLSSLTLLKDHETPFLDKPPAEVVVESTVKYPYLKATEPSDPVLDEVAMERRNAPVISLAKGETRAANLLVFDGPVFDAQTTVALNLKLSETDWYPAGGVKENALSSAFALGSFSGELPLSNGDYTVTTTDARFTLHVSVVPLY